MVGLVDMYVAMTQPRPYRDAKLSFEVIRELLGRYGESFDHRILKTFVSRLGIYPIGSWVALNTQEIARVLKPNQQFPLHPHVEVLLDARGGSPQTPRSYDLYEEKIVYIKEPVDYRKVTVMETMID
jgi:hypothetical protein